MAEKNAINKGVHKQKNLKFLIGLAWVTASALAIGGSVGISYALAQTRVTDYSKITSELEKIAKQVDAVSFRSNKISPFSNFSQLKSEWNQSNDTKKASNFFVLQKFVDGQFINFNLPSSYYVTFSKVTPNDKSQAFDIEFYITTQINGKTFYSKKRNTTVPINVESTFFLNNFSSATKILFNDALKAYDSSSDGHKLAKITLASDFVADVNQAKTSDEAIAKINNYFNIEQLINNLLNNSNFFVNFDYKIIKPYSISLEPAFKNNDEIKWLIPSTTATDTFEGYLKLGFNDEAKKLFPKNFNSDLTTTVRFEIANNQTKLSPFISTSDFLGQVNIESPVAKNYYFSNSQTSSLGLKTTADETTEDDSQTSKSAQSRAKEDISTKSLIQVYRQLKFKDGQLLNTSDEAKSILNSFLQTDLPINFNELDQASDEVHKRFSYEIDVTNIVVGGDATSTYISVPLKILYKSASLNLSKNVTILLRQYEEVTGQPGSYQIKGGAPVVPYIAQIPNVVDNKATSDATKKEPLKSHQLISYEKIEKLVQDQSYNKLLDLLKDPSQFDHTFVEQPFLNAWISKYQLAKISDFNNQTLLPVHIKDNEYTQVFFDSNLSFGQFANKILQLSKENNLAYLTHLFDVLNKDNEQKPEITKGSGNATSSENSVQSGQTGSSNQVGSGSQAQSADTQTSQVSSPTTETEKTKAESKTIKSQIIESLKLVQKTFAINLLDKLIKAVEEKSDSQLSASSFAELFISTYKDDSNIKDYDNFARSLRYNIKFDNTKEGSKQPVATQVADVGQTTTENQATQDSSSQLPKDDKPLELTYHYEFYEVGNPSKIVFKTGEQKLDLMVSSASSEKVENISLAKQVTSNLPAKLHQLVLKNQTLEEFKKKFNGQKMDALDTAKVFQKFFGYQKFMEIQPLLRGLALLYEPNGVSTNFVGETTLKFFLTKISKEDNEKITKDVANEPDTPAQQGAKTSPAAAASPSGSAGGSNSAGVHTGSAGNASNQNPSNGHTTTSQTTSTISQTQGQNGQAQTAATQNQPKEDSKPIGSSIIVFTVSEAKDGQ